MFVTSNDPETAAEDILILNTKYNEKVDIFIRADTMHPPSPYDVMVTINADTEAKFNQMAAAIRGLPGVNNATPSIVNIHKTYHPDPPHSAKGYISSNEHQRDSSGPNAGPQDHNVWG